MFAESLPFLFFSGGTKPSKAADLLTKKEDKPHADKKFFKKNKKKECINKPT